MPSAPASPDRPEELWRELRRLSLSLQTLFPGEWGEFQEFSRSISRAIAEGYRTRSLPAKLRNYRHALLDAKQVENLLSDSALRASLLPAHQRKLLRDVLKLKDSLSGLVQVMAARRRKRKRPAVSAKVAVRSGLPGWLKPRGWRE